MVRRQLAEVVSLLRLNPHRLPCIRYVEWEKCPEKKAKSHKILTSQIFLPNPEFQLGPIPDTNPVLPGTHWKMWHHAIGGELASGPDDSSTTVLHEKHPDMLHLPQFP